MSGASPASWSRSNRALSDLFSCIGAGDIVSAKALLEGKHKAERAALLSATNPAGITLLQHACHGGQSDGVAMLLDKGADPSWTSTKGSTPLHFACNAGHYDCAAALLRAGVNVDAGNANGTTPLIIAAFGAHANCVRLLLEHHADPNVRDKLGRRAGDSLCGVGTGTSRAATPENEPFSETRSILAVARAQRSARTVHVSTGGMGGVSCAASGRTCRDNGHAGTSRRGGSESGPLPVLMTTEEEQSTSPRPASENPDRRACISSNNTSGNNISSNISSNSSSSSGGSSSGSSGSGDGADSGMQQTPIASMASAATGSSRAPSAVGAPAASAAAANAAAAVASPVVTPTTSPMSSPMAPPPLPPMRAASGRCSGMLSPVATTAASSAPELDHPRRQSSRSVELKAALAANAAMIRSMHEEEKTFSVQRDLLERRRGEAGERRKGAEEQAALLRARAGALAREESTPCPPVAVPKTPPGQKCYARGSEVKSPSELPVFEPPSPLSTSSNSDASAFSTPAVAVTTSTAASTPPQTTPPTSACALPEPREEAREGVVDDNSPAVMEDVEDQPQQQGPQQQQQRYHNPSQSTDPCCSGSPFRRSGAQRHKLELRLQSPLRTPGRRGGGGGGSGDDSVGRDCRPLISNGSAGAVTGEQQQQPQPADPEDSSADMVEAETEEAGGATEVSSLLPAVLGASFGRGSMGKGDKRSSRDASAAGTRLLEAKSRRVQELEAELRAARRENRLRDGRNQRSRTNANKRQRAGTSLSSQSRSSQSQWDQQGARGGSFAGGGNQDLPPGSNASCSDAMTPALRNEVRRLRAEAAALGREHASLAAQHASLALEKARQAGVLRSRVASADGEVERLSRQLRDAQDKLQAQARETEGLRRQSEGQQGLLHHRSHDLEQALDRLENIGVALAEERSLNTARRRNNQADVDNTTVTNNVANDGTVNSLDDNHADGDHTDSNSSSRNGRARDTLDTTPDPQPAPSMSVDGNDSDVIIAEDAAVRSVTDDTAGSGNADGEGVEVGEGGGSVPMGDDVREDDEGAGAAGTPVPALAAAGTGQTPRQESGGLEMARIFSHQQIDAACAGFPDSAIVGRGGFGPVFRGCFLGEEVAVKRLDGYGLQGLPNFLREVQVLTTCRHEHLVPLLGICVDPTPMLVYPFVGQSLEWHLREPQRRAAIGWSTRLSVALSVSKGLQYLHQPQAGAWGKPVIVHRDVKTENILMDSNLRARLSDVGIARQLDRGGAEASTRLVGTWGYIDPEYQERGVLTPSSDVFSLGVVFLELLTGSPAHSAQLRPPSLVDRVKGKQLSDCLDSSCTWPDTLAVVSFAKEAWQCVSRRGDDRPRLPHLIERLDRLDIRDTGNGEAFASDVHTENSNSNNDNNNSSSSNGSSGGSGSRSSGGSSPDADNSNNTGPNNAVRTSTPAIPQPAAASSPAPRPPTPLSPVAPPVPPSDAATSTAAANAAAAEDSAATAAREATEAAAESAAAALVARAHEAATVAAPGIPMLVQGTPAVADAAADGVAATASVETASAAVAALSPDPSPSTPGVGRECMICASAPVQTRFLPCRHSLACLNCASLLRARGDRCPVDRARIVGVETGQFQVTYSGPI